MFRKYRTTLNPFSSLLHSLMAGAAFYAFDPEDQATKDAIAAAVDAAVAGLKTKNAELLAEVKANKRKGGEVDHAELERTEAERDKALSDLAEVQKQLKTATKGAEESTKTLQAEQGYTSRLLIDNGLAAALAEAGVSNPVHAKAAAALLRASSQIAVKVEGDARSAMVGDKPLSEFVKAWSQGDEGKQFVAAQGNSGSGASGSGGAAGTVNPWAKDTFNLTQQGKILTENPAQAAAFKSAAGIATPP